MQCSLSYQCPPFINSTYYYVTGFNTDGADSVIGKCVCMYVHNIYSIRSIYSIPPTLTPTLREPSAGDFTGNDLLRMCRYLNLTVAPNAAGKINKPERFEAFLTYYRNNFYMHHRSTCVLGLSSCMCHTPSVTLTTPTSSCVGDTDGNAAAAAAEVTTDVTTTVTTPVTVSVRW